LRSDGFRYVGANAAVSDQRDSVADAQGNNVERDREALDITGRK